MITKIKDGFTGSRAIVLPPAIISEIEKDNFGAKLHLTDIGYYPNARYHYRKRKSGISQYIIILCVNGKGWFEINGCKHNVSKNQFFILPPDKPHSYGADDEDPWSIYWIHFKGEQADFYANTTEGAVDIAQTDESRLQDRISIFEDIFRTLQNGYAIENINYAISCLYYFLGSLKYLGQFKDKANSESGRDIIDRSIKYIRENIESDITIKSLCEHVGYSESHFSSIFRKQTGFTPINYIQHLRIQTACNLLDFSEMKINQISFKVGISDPYYFSRLFTRITGLTPTEYRKNKKG
jgi:AraC-like DNA-binding protein